MYISIRLWRDLTDGHLYHPGEAFPHDGRAIPGDRIAALLNGSNKAGFALIQACGEKDKEKPVQKEETPKKPVRSRKKAG